MAEIANVWIIDIRIEVMPGAHYEFKPHSPLCYGGDTVATIGKAFLLVKHKTDVTCQECLELIHA